MNACEWAGIIWMVDEVLGWDVVLGLAGGHANEDWRSNCTQCLVGFLNQRDAIHFEEGFVRAKAPALSAGENYTCCGIWSQEAGSIVMTMDFEVGVLLRSAVLLIGTSTFVSGKYVATHRLAIGKGTT